MSDPLFAFQAIARSARRRILARIAASKAKSRTAALAIVRKELAESEPLLARTLRDAQLLAWLTAGQAVAKPLALPAAEGHGRLVEPPVKSLPREYAGIPGDSYPAGLVLEDRSKSLPPSPPARIHFPDAHDDPPPVIRLPQVERAAKYLQTRLDYTPEEFAQLDDDARSVAFTVAKAQTLDAVTRIRKALTEDVEVGGTLKAFKAVVREALEGSALADHHVESLYRTQTALAYSAGQIDVLRHPLVSDEFPYILYDFTHDSRVRPEHVWLGTHGLNGTGIRRADDPFWKTWYPPCGYNCRCVALPITLEMAAEYGVREAIEWLRTGIEPSRPEFCERPSFKLPKNWVPVGDRLHVAM